MSPLQRRLLLLFALLLAFQTLVLIAKYFADLDGSRFGGDFISFWRAAQNLGARNLAAIYNPGGWERVLAQPERRELGWFVYPPFALLGLWPLGSMGYGEAVAWWSLAPLPVYFTLLWLLLRQFGPDLPAFSRRAAFPVAGALTLPLLSANLFTGQTGAWIAVFMMGAALNWSRRPVLTGVWIGLLAIKPQFGLLIPFALLASGQWRTIAAAAGTVVTLAAVTTIWLGGAIWLDYIAMTKLFGRFIGEGYGGIRQLALGPFVSLQATGVPALTAGLVQGAVSMSVAAAVTWVFWRGKAHIPADGRLDLRLGILAAGTLLATPYALTYDTPLLALAIVPLIARAFSGGLRGIDVAAFAGVAVVPFAPAALLDYHLPFACVAVAFAFAVLLARYRAEERGRAGSASSRFSLAT